MEVRCDSLGHSAGLAGTVTTVVTDHCCDRGGHGRGVRILGHSRAGPAPLSLVPTMSQPPADREHDPRPPLPVLNALLVCDEAIKEEIGIFETMRVPRFPARLPRLCVYVKMTDAEGQYEIILQLIRLDDLQVIGERRLTAALGDRMAAGELVFRFRTLTLLHPGRYEFRLFADGRTLGWCSLRPQGGTDG